MVVAQLPDRTGRDVQAQVGEAGEQHAEHDLTLQARQRRTQAVVDAVPERQVRVGRTGEVHPVARLELRRVPVRRLEVEHELAALRNQHTADLHVLAGEAHVDGAGTVQAQQLVDGTARYLRGTAYRRLFVGVGEQPQDGVAQEARGGVEARVQQQPGGADDLVRGEPVVVVERLVESGQQVVRGY